MTVFHWLRRRLVEAPGSLGERSRQRRWQVLLTHFPNLADMTVIDLGGRVEAWRSAPVLPRHVVVLNLLEGGENPPEWSTFVQGDACNPPAEICEQRFDLVFSNSLLEHVGGHARRRQFAETVHGLSARHWVQTPYRYFPVEPHWLFPGFQFLPLLLRAKLSRVWPLQHTRAATSTAALENALDVELVGKTEMGYLFPRSHLVAEKAGPFTKSLVAVKTG
ncbi:MAG: class I SAM-dependent methyltransferase [Egibacteraceae bacterium]